MSASQLSEWEAYDRLDPIGDFRGDYHMAHLAATVTNLVKQIYAEKGKKPKLDGLWDHMPKWYVEEESVEDKSKKLPKQQTEVEMKSALQHIANVLGTTKKLGEKSERDLRPPKLLNKE